MIFHLKQHIFVFHNSLALKLFQTKVSMKKILLLGLSLHLLFIAHSAEWMNVKSDLPQEARVSLVSSSISTSRIVFELDGFFKNEVMTPRGEAWQISLKKGGANLNQGTPDLPVFASSVIIPDRAKMELYIISAAYVEYENVLIVPSKGNLTRDVNPSDIPYLFGKVYEIDSDYPGKLGNLADPYIIRDYRGQALQIHPFQYNPVTKRLKVYYHIEFGMVENGQSDKNAIDRNQAPERINSRFSTLYERHFINYASAGRYDPVEEEGSMLIITHEDFMDEIEPLAAWKRMSGTPCEVVNVEDIGGADDIKQYIQAEYENGDLTFVLLVGDADIVPVSQSMGNDSDNDYTYVAGDDHYPDLFIGRFSANTEEHVNTMVNRTLTYEMDPASDTAWYTRAIGIASKEGPGDDGELDFEHLRNISETKLIPFTYSYTYEFFEGSQGGNDGDGYPSAEEVGVAVDSGASLINYTGHGSTTSWGTSGFSNWDINALSNTGKWPFIISVACVNGNFVGATCFAEAWTRAEKEGEPTGAIATLMSTINQSWNPPMRGQDEMNSILTEAYEENIKRTFGGITMNGCMNMNDVYGQGGFTETDCWTIFGDPSVVVRTAIPAVMEVNHSPAITLGETSFTVGCNAEGALATLSLDGDILGSAVVSSGSATIEFDPVSVTGIADIVITAFNYKPYISTVELIPADGPYLIVTSVTVSDEAANGNGLLDYAESGIFLTIGLTNIGTETAAGVEASLAGDLVYLEMDGSLAEYGDIFPEDTVYVTNGFVLSVADSVPDLFELPFSFTASDTDENQWESTFNLTAHAPDLVIIDYTIHDQDGNDNQKLDPGETANISISMTNAGSSEAYEIVSQLSSMSDYVDIFSEEQLSGDLAAGDTATVTFSLAAAGDTPEGHLADLILEMAAEHNISGEVDLSLLIGRKPLLVVNLTNQDRTSDSLALCLDMLQVNADFTDQIPLDPGVYKSMFVLLGVYPENHILSQEEGALLAEFLDDGGKIYMEGGDTWAFDDATTVHEYFNIQGLSDGGGDLFDVIGMEGGFLSWFSFSYAGMNNYIDQIGPMDSAKLLLINQEPEYGVAVSYDGGSYQTVGASFEFAGLVDLPGSSKDEMVAEILEFFGIGYTWTAIQNNEVTDQLVSVFPNPSTGKFTLEINLNQQDEVSISVYDMTGRLVDFSTEEFGRSGKYLISRDLSNTTGSGTGNGLYIIKVRVGNNTYLKKLILNNQ